MKDYYIDVDIRVDTPEDASDTTKSFHWEEFLRMPAHDTDEIVCDDLWTLAKFLAENPRTNMALACALTKLEINTYKNDTVYHLSLIYNGEDEPEVVNEDMIQQSQMVRLLDAACSIPAEQRRRLAFDFSESSGLALVTAADLSFEDYNIVKKRELGTYEILKRAAEKIGLAVAWDHRIKFVANNNNE